MGEFPIPTWLTTILPVLVLVLTFALGKIPAIAQFGKRNLSAVVALVLTTIVVATNPPLLPQGEIMEMIEGYIAIALWAWKGAQWIYDAITQQLDTPDGHARR